MKKYKIGDVLIRTDGGGIRVIESDITGEYGEIFFLSTICDDGDIHLFPHFKQNVYGSLYKKLEI